ncbi:hypothetical protein C0992_012564 [Termitomyces sp. T32_za158]|nr:hypothetical protein C0992_012564 [Termitomyces sp. T32_za158]
MAYVPHVYPAGASESDYSVPSYTASDPTDYYTIDPPNGNTHPHCNWQFIVPTDDASYNSAPLAAHMPARLSSQSSELPLHAPAPLSGQSSSLLTSQCTNTYYPIPMELNEMPINQSQIAPPTLPPPFGEPCKSLSGRESSATQRPPTTFPTPSAMLTELSAHPRPPSLMVQTSEPKNETARKARRRAMAQTIGFEPTDPYVLPFSLNSILISSSSDVISSHEKKRHYLECLEYYVTYLHQQLSLVGYEPVRLERPTTSTRGMSSQSIRVNNFVTFQFLRIVDDPLQTLLVHMEHLTRRLNQEMLVEEQRVSLLFKPIYTRNFDARYQFIYLRSMAEQLQDSQSTQA